MSDTSVSLEKLIADAIDARLRDVYTTAVGVVKAYYPTGPYGSCADIDLVVPRPVPLKAGGYRFEPYPPLYKVPIAWLGNASNVQTWPLNPGDHVLVFATMLDHAAWRANGAPGLPPAQLDAHNLGSAFALPCVRPDAQAPSSASQAAHVLLGTQVRIGAVSSEETSPAVSAAGLRAILEAIVANWTVVPEDGGAALKAYLSSLLGNAKWPDQEAGAPNVRVTKPV